MASGLWVMNSAILNVKKQERQQMIFQKTSYTVLLLGTLLILGSSQACRTSESTELRGIGTDENKGVVSDSQLLSELEGQVDLISGQLEKTKTDLQLLTLKLKISMVNRLAASSTMSVDSHKKRVDDLLQKIKTIEKTRGEERTQLIK